MTERLYYSDSYLTQFDAQVLEARAGIVYLDRTAFYPTSGGQLHDTGVLGGVAVREVTEDEDGRIAHHVDADLPAGRVAGAVDWARRFDFMQQHTGQHLLSAVFESLFGLSTVSVHFGEEAATLDLAAPSLSAEQQRAAEARANELVWENRPVTVAFVDAGAAEGLRKASEREGTLRIVSIEGLDRSACGGTHVRATGAIGPIVIRRLDKIRGNVRVEFLCGQRAWLRLRADMEALGETARLFSSTPDETPALVAALQAEARDSAKRLRKFAAELAGHRGRALYESTPAGPSGRRVHIERRASGTFDDETRALANAYIEGAAAVFMAVVEDPPSLLLAVSEDTGVNAGALLKQQLNECQGRGGGTPRLAQGSLPTREALAALLARLAAML